MTVTNTFVSSMSPAGVASSTISWSRITKSAFFPGCNEPKMSSVKDAYAASSVAPFNACARVSFSEAYLNRGQSNVHEEHTRWLTIRQTRADCGH